MKKILGGMALCCALSAAAAPLTAELECLPPSASANLRDWLADRLALRDIQLVERGAQLKLCFREERRQQWAPAPGWNAAYARGGWAGGWGGWGGPAYEPRDETVLTLSVRQAGSGNIWWQSEQALSREGKARQASELAMRALLERMPQPQ